MRGLTRVCCIVLGCVLAATAVARAAEPKFKLAPAVAVEAEDFAIDRGWRVVKFGEGNYSVDIIGFVHTSGERFLSTDAADKNAEAHKDITVPQPGKYRLWVRYEYMPFTDTRFHVSVVQNGKVVAEKVVGAKNNPRWAFGEHDARPQYDPPWGNEGLVEELIEVPDLTAGPAKLVLKAVDQPQTPGRSADRNIDLLYLTSDLTDAWRKHYAGAVYYPILDAFRDTYGPRYEVRITNKSSRPLTLGTWEYYNRNPFYQHQDPAALVKDLPAGEASAWLPLSYQDTSHNGMVLFDPTFPAAPQKDPQAFVVEIRPIGGAVEETVASAGETVRIFMPPYPNKGEKAVDLMKELDAIIKHLKDTPAPGKNPTRPLCYGWCVPFAEDSEYSRRYARLFAALGMRSYLPVPSATGIKNLADAGVPLTKSVCYGEYRFPPTDKNIAEAKARITKECGLDKLRWFDFGDEIAFSEWVSYMVADQRDKLGNKDLKTEDVVRPLWREWLAKNRPGYKVEEYWLAGWGELNQTLLRPDSTAAAAKEKPRLYVDSVLFYEDAAIAYVAAGSKKVKAELGPDVLTGCNYSGYPFYYPHSTPYIKWFRDGAADFGRHSEYFWELGQVTPMINGYFSEFFRCGMRFNPKAIVRQYTMPHSPGNTDASFRRTFFTHLAHGAKNIDFFGIGMNETFTENYIDHRDRERYRAIRDFTHAAALVEDVIEESQAVPSRVALLVSESTEKWDWSGVAADFASATWGDKDSAFRKVRLSFHQDRVGIYTALTFAGEAPDVLVERDLNADILKGYKALYLVGDSIPASVVPAVEAWVKEGGVLFATAGVGRYGMYREPNPELQKLLGIESRQLEERDIFIRTSQELPFLKPFDTVTFRDVMSLEFSVGGTGGRRGKFPALATYERIKAAADAQVMATFDDKSPAVIHRKLGNGYVFYTASFPGMAYLYKGLTTPKIYVPDRGPAAHRAVTTYDIDAAHFILHPLRVAGVTPRINTQPGYIDTRLIRQGKVFFLSMANYNEKVDQPVRLRITPPSDAGEPTKATSAFNGNVTIESDKTIWIVSLPKLGYGDIVRIDTK